MSRSLDDHSWLSAIKHHGVGLSFVQDERLQRIELAGPRSRIAWGVGLGLACASHHFDSYGAN